MTVLGIDVGIKSLAMCILDNKSIVYWDVLNLIGDNNTCNKNTVKGVICGKKASLLYNDVYYCKTHCKDNDAKKISDPKVKNINFQRLTKVILESLDSVYKQNADVFDTVTDILVEFQPKINVKMKFASHVIFSKFVDIYNTRKVNIRFVTANKKTKLSKQSAGINTYKQRKNDSVIFITEHLSSTNTSDKWVTKFNSHKKKDDLADAMCYALIGSC
jgi:hypothetical protein